MVRNYWDPWSEFDRLQRQMNDVFGRLGDTRAAEFPQINVWANEEGAVVTTELPGVDSKRIEISVLGDTVSIKGSREEFKAEEGRTMHRRERGFGPFDRTVQLPFRVDGDKVDARYRRGVLEIRAPRASGDRARSIAVLAG